MPEPLFQLLRKYDRAAPRYTSYPTAPEWSTDFDAEDHRQAIERSNAADRDLSLYFHIPFCHSACHYCACNIVISPHGQTTEPYLQALKREIQHLAGQIDNKRTVRQIHFGGGTPTYLTPEQIADLYAYIAEHFRVGDNAEIGIEIDPRVTSQEHLQVCRQLGFNRLSMGVQDFDGDVQQAVNRVQSYQMIAEMLDFARELGYQSINFDLIYGLPLQTAASFAQTIQQVIALQPARIALFNYAHLPSLRPFQKAYIKEEQLPASEAKLDIFCMAIDALQGAGYEYIGMDHFALRSDSLYRARQERSLHRNFQGYTTWNELDLLGMGLSAISSIDNAYSQNEKKLNRYIDAFAQESITLPIEKGIAASPEDLLRRDVINRLLCDGYLSFAQIEHKHQLADFRAYFAEELQEIARLAEDDLLHLQADSIEVSELGKIFLRNIALVFDARLKQREHLFSRTV